MPFHMHPAIPITLCASRSRYHIPIPEYASVGVVRPDVKPHEFSMTPYLPETTHKHRTAGYERLVDSRTTRLHPIPKFLAYGQKLRESRSPSVPKPAAIDASRITEERTRVYVSTYITIG